MNVLFISSWYPNKLEPTNGNFVQRHAEAVALQHNVEVLHSIGDNHLKEKFLFDDQAINGIRTLIVYYRNSTNPVKNFIRRMQAYNLGYKRLQKPDIVHANVMHNNMLFAVYLKKKFNIPFVVTEHWSGFTQQKISKSSLLIVNYIAENASLIMPVSGSLMTGLKNLGLKKEMQVIGNVVDVETFTPTEKQQEGFIFLHISNLIPLKNWDKIIEAAVSLYKEEQNFQLHIGGDGDINSINLLVKQYNAGSYIKTFGEISSHEVSIKMKQADCFVLFSDYETQSCVLLESFATGIPVIATNVGGIPEIVNKERGILVEKNNTNDLKNAMFRVLQNNVSFQDPKSIRSFVVENFSKAIIAKKFTKIYKSINI